MFDSKKKSKREIYDIVALTLKEKTKNFDQLSSMLNDYKLVEKEFIDQISRLPAKKILQATVISNIRSPLTALAYNIKYPLSRLILTLKTFSEQKDKGEKCESQ